MLFGKLKFCYLKLFVKQLPLKESSRCRKEKDKSRSALSSKTELVYKGILDPNLALQLTSLCRRSISTDRKSKKKEEIWEEYGQKPLERTITSRLSCRRHLEPEMLFHSKFQIGHIQKKAWKKKISQKKSKARRKIFILISLRYMWNYVLLSTFKIFPYRIQVDWPSFSPNSCYFLLVIIK